MVVSVVDTVISPPSLSSSLDIMDVSLPGKAEGMLQIGEAEDTGVRVLRYKRTQMALVVLAVKQG